MYSSGFIKRHTVLSFYILTFGISWGGILVEVSHGGVPGNPAQLAKRIPVMILEMLAGPAVASILMTGLVGGSAACRELWVRLSRWRIGLGWYSVALLTAPLVLMAVPLALSLRYPDFLPRIFTESAKRPLLMMGFAAGSVVGIFEELGWTGFVIPRLRVSSSALRTAVIVGLLWGAWHVPVNILASGTPSGAISIPGLLGTLLFSFGVLPAFRILMVAAWDHTNSLLLAILMHVSLTASNIILGATATPGAMAVTFNLALAAAMWVMASFSIAACREPVLMH